MQKNSPSILTGLGVAGLISTAVATAKAMPTVIRHLNQRRDELGLQNTDELPFGEKLSATWKDFVSPAAIGVTSAACIIGANSVNGRRNAALATAYTLTETKAREYAKKVREYIGEEADDRIKSSVNQEYVDNHPVKEVIITDGEGDICLDSMSGRYFKTTTEKLRAAENELNKRLLQEMNVSLNDLYDLIDLEETSLGDLVGWSIDKGLIEFQIDTALSKNDRPILVLDFVVCPIYDYC